LLPTENVYTLTGALKTGMANSQQKQRMGRPPISEDGDSVVATVRLTPEQDRAIRRAAKRRKQQRSEWMRSVLFEAAQIA